MRFGTSVRDIFDVVLDDYDNMDKYLATDADIIEFPLFESGLAKIQAGVESALSRRERKALERLVAMPIAQPESAVAVEQPSTKRSKRKRDTDALEEKIRKRVHRRCGPQSKFIDTSWIPPTSVVAERFFFDRKSTVGYLRKSMSHETLEVIMFLKLNWDLVTLADVSKAIEMAKQQPPTSDSQVDL